MKDADDLIDQLERDLIQKAVQALKAADIGAKVYGVFSLDDLENQKEEDMDDLIAVGVGYQGATNTSIRNGTDKDKVDVAVFQFMILLACPSGPSSDVRAPATTVLGALRRGIRNSSVGSVEAPKTPDWQTVGIRPAKGSTQRPWQWIQEVPQVEESTNTMLYYTQIWRLTLPVVST